MIKNSLVGKILIVGSLAVLIGYVLISQLISGNKKNGINNNLKDVNTVCSLTRTDALGPFYKTGATITMRTGSGELKISGKVLRWPSCIPVKEATIEFWQANRSGEYSDDQRAMVIADEDGYFEYKSDYPGIYESRPAHIHVKVSNQEIEDLITQIYPETVLTAGEIKIDLIVLEKNAVAPSWHNTETPLQPNQ